MTLFRDMCQYWSRKCLCRSTWFLWGSCCSSFSFLCSALFIIVYSFVLFGVIVLSVLLRFFMTTLVSSIFFSWGRYFILYIQVKVS